MGDNPLEVDWGWYNGMIAFLGFIPFLGTMALGAPTQLLKSNTQGLNEAFALGMAIGGFWIVFWIHVISNYTKESGVPVDSDE